MAIKIWLGTTDGDVTTAGNWSPSGQPTAADDVIITGAVSIDGATLSSAGNLASFVIRDYTGTIGSESSDLVVDLAASSTVEIATTGKAYIDFNASDVDVNINQTAAVVAPESGLHLKGSSMNDVNLYGSSTVLIVEDDVDADINLLGTSTIARLGSGGSAVNVSGIGSAFLYGSVTNIYANGQAIYYYGSGAITTTQAENGATIYHETAANITNANAYGGNINANGSNESVTVTNTNLTGGGEVVPGRNWAFTNEPTQPYKLVSI